MGLPLGAVADTKRQAPTAIAPDPIAFWKAAPDKEVSR
jgi:hypothetical protein